ncbi:c-type heme family protein [Rubinisphaera margarita]|uniref:c-type heme family protein n=1 Tax=Rubinisphaera margarita TaxID=2909586 RepID=UPI001EE86AF1|nr:DUF3365 domain-containing protein [Rubinisphaera margarita]MCG6154594.1 DUF3365 domain-containing protein [Rubinisphaera margarita]
MRSALIALTGLAIVVTSHPARCETPEAASVVRENVVQARREAEVLHDTIHATLQLVHHAYYREDEGLPIPAATLKDVFEEVEKHRQVKLRWLAVDGQAMNVDHLPADEFETQAVEKLSAGEGSHEQTVDGIYRRAAAIKLTNVCLKCHLPDRTTTEARTAGLIVTIPIAE